jgi:hypothetical protein
MPRVRFEPTIPVFERKKTFCALHRAAIVPGSNLIFLQFDVAVSTTLMLKEIAGWYLHWVTSNPIRIRGFPLSLGKVNAIID